jgi:NADH-quinone oxidoreductase subunit B
MASSHNTTKMEMGGGDAGFVTTRFEDILAWARKWSLFQYPFVTACCGMEFMSLNGPRYDGLARFGAEAPRFSPRQADLLWVVGTVSQRQAPALRRIYEQMAEPKYVLAFGTCASCGGFYDNYATVPGIDKIVPVDVFIPGCPPRPEAVLDGLMMLQEKISHTTGTSRGVPMVVPPRELPQMTQIRKKGTAVYHGRDRMAEERQLGAGSGQSLGDLLGTSNKNPESVALHSSSEAAGGKGDHH